jgi:hypothetical protein
MDAFRERPDLMHCYLAKAISLDVDGVEKYADWGFSKSSEPSFHAVAHRPFRVSLPTVTAADLKAAGDAFQRCYPTTDDL